MDYVNKIIQNVQNRSRKNYENEIFPNLMNEPGYYQLFSVFNPKTLHMTVVNDNPLP